MKRLIPILSYVVLAAGSCPVRAAPPPAGTDVYVEHTGGYFGYRIPAIETAPDGSLLAFAEARKNHMGDPGEKGQAVDLVSRRSTDGGKTWSAMKVIENPGVLWSAGNPATLVDRANGRIWLLYIRCKPGRDYVHARAGTDDSQQLARTSDDNGLTWSEPIDLTRVSRDFADPRWRVSMVGPGGMIQTRSGRLVAPCWKFEPFESFALYSDDHGKTWQRSSFVKGIGVNECQMVELSSGGLLMDLRMETDKHRFQSTSGDGGKTWGAMRPGAPNSPVSCAIERYTSKAAGDDRDRIIWTGPKGPDRQNLVARISYDQGVTFPVERLIHAGPAAYSDLTILNDRSIGLLWERGVTRGYQSITFTRLTREFLEP